MDVRSERQTRALHLPSPFTPGGGKIIGGAHFGTLPVFEQIPEEGRHLMSLHDDFKPVIAVLTMHDDHRGFRETIKIFWTLYRQAKTWVIRCIS